MKFATLDIETSNLNADFGFIVCVVIKTYGKRERRVFRIDDYEGWESHVYDDRLLVKDVRDYLDQFDGIITYNGKRFDLPFLNSQCAVYGYLPIKPLFHIDVLMLTRFNLKLHNNRLNSLIEFFNSNRSSVKKIEQKTAINSINYKKAITGDKAGIEYIVKHCIIDVDSLEDCYDLLKHNVSFIRKGW